MNFWERVLFLIGVTLAPDDAKTADRGKNPPRLVTRTGRRTFEHNERLHSALIDLAEQESKSTEEVQEDLLTYALTQRQSAGELWKRWERLSPREKDVVALTCLGYTNREIAVKMCLSPDTVRGYVRQVRVKFETHSKDELRSMLKDWDFSAWGEKAQD